MSTFIEDNNDQSSTTAKNNKQQSPPTTTKPTTASSSIASTSVPKITTPNIPFSDYTNSLNIKYQEKIKLAAQRSNYTLELVYEDGKTTHYTYTRMKLLQWQFDEIEDLRSEAAELAISSVSAIKANKKLKEMYMKAAKYLLFNTTTEKPMTEEEYRHCFFSELRPAIDSSILLSLVSDPN